MAICVWCGQEMTSRKTLTCFVQSMGFPDGKRLPCVPWMGEERCHDCGVVHEGHHHPGCDMEICPRCGGQLISCGCLNEPDPEPEAIDWTGGVLAGSC